MSIVVAVRDTPDPIEYDVAIGEKADRHWIKNLVKKFKKSNHPWARLEKSLIEEYKFIDQARINYSKRYNIISCSDGGDYLFIKNEVRIPGNDRSGSGAGLRAGIFIENKKRVLLLFVGFHDEYDKLGFSSDKECFMHLLKEHYPDLHKLFIF